MKQLGYMCVILIAFAFASCGYKSVETSLDDEFISFTAQTEDGQIVYGVKDKTGHEILPARYEDISLYAGGILAKDEEGLWLYHTDGTLVYDGPSEDIFTDNEHLIFQTHSDRYLLVPAGGTDVQGPFTRIERHGSRYLFAQDDMGLGCMVFNDEGKPLVSGGRIIFLFSKADAKYYFIVLNDEKTATAFDENGQELFPLDRKKMQKLPKPEWSDISVEKIVTKNKLEVFKASRRRR